VIHCYSLVAKAKTHNLWASLNNHMVRLYRVGLSGSFRSEYWARTYTAGNQTGTSDLARHPPLTSKLLSLSLICESKQVSVVTQSSRRKNVYERLETLTRKPKPQALAQGSGSFSKRYAYISLMASI